MPVLEVRGDGSLDQTTQLFQLQNHNVTRGHGGGLERFGLRHGGRRGCRAEERGGDVALWWQMSVERRGAVDVVVADRCL